MPQFSIKRLLASVTLIAVGCGLLTWAANAGPPPSKDPLSINLMALCVGTCSLPWFGTGIGLLFKAPIVGLVAASITAGMLIATFVVSFVY